MDPQTVPARRLTTGARFAHRGDTYEVLEGHDQADGARRYVRCRADGGHVVAFSFEADARFDLKKSLKDLGTRADT